MGADDGTARATVRQAAILVGGLGSRLGDATARTPKPILRCGDRPFLGWLIRELSRFGIEEVLLLAGHLSPVLEASLPAIARSLPRPVTITCSVEPARAGTGGALFHARDALHERFLLCNGDSMLDVNLARLLGGQAHNTIVLRHVADTDRYGVVDLDGDRVASFRPRVAPGRPGLVNAGLYLLGRDVRDVLAPVCSLEGDVLPALAAGGRLGAHVTGGFFIDIGVPGDLARAQTEIPARLHRRALFLDRDGTINLDHGWVGTRDRWQWVEGAIEAIRLAADAGWHVFVVTNQSGIARGLYDEDALAALHAWMTGEIRAQGGNVDDIRFCPCHEEATVPRYRRASDWRKPAPGMILDLIARWELDPSDCVLVGDQRTDLQAAAAAGIRGTLFEGGNLRDTIAPLLR